MKKKSIEKTYWLFLCPSLIGLLVFYIIPFFISFYYALIDNNLSKRFVGLKNFINTFNNQIFQTASFNTFRFIAIVVPLSMIISLILALLLNKLPRGKPLVSLLYMLPLAIPSGSISFFWKSLFDANGLINKVLFSLGFSNISFSQSNYTRIVIIIIFLWKNLGYNIILFWSGLNWIPKDYYEFAILEGANSFEKFKFITAPSLLPTTFMVFLLSIVNSFLVYKEAYLLYGNYPNESIYFLQHYMNNQFETLNMQKLASSGYILVITIGGIIAIIFYMQRKLTDKYS